MAAHITPTQQMIQDAMNAADGTAEQAEAEAGCRYRITQIVHAQVFNGVTVRPEERTAWIVDSAADADRAIGSASLREAGYRLTITPWDGTGPALGWSRWDDRQGIYSYEIRPID